MLEHIITIKYHSQTRFQVERFNSTLFSLLLYYVFERRMDWDTYILLLTHVYNKQMHRFIKVFLFSLAHTSTPSG